jgi:hypothetical protein
MNELDRGYSVEIDRIDKPHWHELLKEFDDATFYQTWSYGDKFWGTRNASHVILRHEGRVVSLAQLRILRYPVLHRGAAYLNWGPLWRRKGEGDNRAHFRSMLRALFNEYVLKRNYALRILPKVFDTPENDEIRNIFLEERYACSPDSLRTFVVDLRPSIEEIRQNLHRSWKRSLKFAEEQDLEVFEAKDREQFALVAALNKEMRDRKQFYGGDVGGALEVNSDLPQELRLKILLCSHKGETIAALGWSNMGKVCLPIVSGTGDKALQFKASFLLFWGMVQHAKENGAAFCDTAGVHEKRNPGSYFFKKGLAGKDAQEVTYMGKFDAYKSYPSFLLFKTAMAVREKIINGARNAKTWLR